LTSNPGDEAALELLGVKDCDDVAKMIVRGRTVLERAEAAEEFDFLDAEEGDFGEGLGARQNRDKAKKQNLVERIGHLALLAWIVQILEIAQEYDGFVERNTVRCRGVHGRSPACESKGVIDSAL